MTEVLHQQQEFTMEKSLMERVNFLESNYEEYNGKVNNLNTNFQISKGRLDGFGKELKILLAEINIIAEWIYDRFDVQLIDKQSLLFKHIQEYDEVENISSSISMAKHSLKSSASSFPSSKNRDSGSLIETSDETGDDEDDDEEGPEIEGQINAGNEGSSEEDENETEGEGEGLDVDFAGPEEFINAMYEDTGNVEADAGGADGSRPRRKSRRKINYKEAGADPNEQEFSVEGKLKKKSHKNKKRKPATSETGKKVLKKRGRKPDGRLDPTELGIVEMEATKVPKRGRPKKAQSEKIENWKNRLPVQCDECGKIFKGAGSLRTHKMIHLGSRPFECSQCGKAFRRKHHLEFHLMVHAGDKKLQCRFCGKLFHIPRDLMRHERTHTGEKPYACHFCPKTFNIKPHLTMHIRTHTGERPYKCSICEKCFSQSNSLRIHKKIHFKSPNPNVDSESKKKPKTTGRNSGGSRKPKSSGSRATESVIATKPADSPFDPTEIDGIELRQTETSTIIIDGSLIDTSRGTVQNLILIPEHLNPSTEGSLKDSSQSQGIANYIEIEETPNSSMQQQINFFDPVQQAWRLAISQPQQTQTTSVIMNTRIDNHSGQIVEIRNSNDRSLPIPNSTNGTTTTTTFGIPQFYDPNIRYFGS